MYKFPRGRRWLLSGRLPRVDFLVTVATVTSDDLAEVPPSEFAPSVLLTQVPLHTHTPNHTREFIVNSELHMKRMRPTRRKIFIFFYLNSTF